MISQLVSSSPTSGKPEPHFSLSHGILLLMGFSLSFSLSAPGSLVPSLSLEKKKSSKMFKLGKCSIQDVRLCKNEVNTQRTFKNRVKLLWRSANESVQPKMRLSSFGFQDPLLLQLLPISPASLFPLLELALSFYMLDFPGSQSPKHFSGTSSLGDLNSSPSFKYHIQ